MHFLRELDARFREVTGDTAASPQIYFDTQGFKRLNRKDGLYADPADIARSLKAMGYSHLRLVCLWYTDETRLRMLQGLCDAYGLEPEAGQPSRRRTPPLQEGIVSAVFHEAPKFLSPRAGRRIPRPHRPDRRPAAPEPGTLTGVWAETEYNSPDEETSETDEQDAPDEHRPAQRS